MRLISAPLSLAIETPTDESSTLLSVSSDATMNPSLSMPRCSFRQLRRLSEVLCLRACHSPSPTILRPVESMTRWIGPSCIFAIGGPSTSPRLETPSSRKPTPGISCGRARDLSIRRRRRAGTRLAQLRQRSLEDHLMRLVTRLAVVAGGGDERANTPTGGSIPRSVLVSIERSICVPAGASFSTNSSARLPSSLKSANR